MSMVMVAGALAEMCRTSAATVDGAGLQAPSAKAKATVWPFGRGRPRRDRELLVQGRLAEETEMVPPSIEEGRGDGRDERVQEGKMEKVVAPHREGQAGAKGDDRRRRRSTLKSAHM